MKTMTWPEFAEAYYGPAKPDSTKSDRHNQALRQKSVTELAKRLTKVKKTFHPDGFFVGRCVVLDSSFLGQNTVLPYGGGSTHKTVPTSHYSPRGLASDLSEVFGVVSATEVPEVE